MTPSVARLWLCPARKKPTSDRQGVENYELGSASSCAQEECTSCNRIGQYADELGLSACKTAPAGTKPTSDRRGVVTCPAGTYSTGGAEECSGCESGEISNAGAAGCRNCAACGLGKYQNAETASTETQCGDCVAGKASMGGAVNECTLCDCT
ncbi:hypothetical protein TrVE_jg10071 [Triparma verrucosa]|uniref:Uncharacterized protein n=1 Tax=Triparma verrucosa TaxID=1606542 RepID=A0A9W7CKH4_9STRA|nr:hypothetical protein TrVE_jg10071 [Triparma verrucosa]